MGRASSVGFVRDRSDLPGILYPLEIEGRRKFGNEHCTGFNGCQEAGRSSMEAGRRNRESKLKTQNSPSPTLSFYSLDWCGPNSFKSPNYCLGTDWRFRYAISRLYVFGTTRIFSRLHPRRTERKSRIFPRFRFQISQ